MIAAASSGETMPCAPSIAACALEPATACRHRRLSNGIEAFISRITAAGPSAKRPPHIALDASMSFRSTIVPLLMLGLLAGCDRQVSPSEQADAHTLPIENEGTPAGGGTQSADKAPGNEVVADTIGTLDRSHKGEAAPAVPFQDPA